jgi:dihydroorotate dehydrogenase electron transfer subunit
MPTSAAEPGRGSILIETGQIIGSTAFAGAQCVLRIDAPRIAGRCEAGQFVHLRCAPDLLMRRPMSIMRADGEQGWIEILFKVHGVGTRLLAERRTGEKISLLGPIGQPFKQRSYKPRTLLIGGGVGMPPIVFLAEHLRAQPSETFVILGSEVPFPFAEKPSGILVRGIPSEVHATMPLLEDWSIACRLASGQGYAGCFDGTATELAEHWIRYHGEEHASDMEVFACGPTPMLKAVAELAARFGLPCQISLEEYMACGVGACAGCAVPIHCEGSIAMKRVCVDGPVFEAGDVVFS